MPVLEPVVVHDSGAAVSTGDSVVDQCLTTTLALLVPRGVLLPRVYLFTLPVIETVDPVMEIACSRVVARDLAPCVVIHASVDEERVANADRELADVHEACHEAVSDLLLDTIRAHRVHIALYNIFILMRQSENLELFSSLLEGIRTAHSVDEHVLEAVSACVMFGPFFTVNFFQMSHRGDALVFRHKIRTGDLLNRIIFDFAFIKLRCQSHFVVIAVPANEEDVMRMALMQREQLVSKTNVSSALIY
eukprot:TRINITY_DN1906_c0_g1::TRINITY_DN1906_c0_g1_i1::g.23164::m.23164 TRINITY_DN1906_c0_g1::TRINITY_DN1906_c0_g1_i1::g.23164  ORF type:complete len:248 (-),score=12.09,SPAM/PF02090.10/0.0078 TRINITY_DN1906_c0_g1_i1:308-1051(-)